MARRSTTARYLLWSAAAMILLVLLLAGAWRLHKSRSVQLFGGLVSDVATADSVVALTFDDGPRAPHTAAVLELLRKEGVRATFFVVGEALTQHPELARRIVDEGHELGNHSYSHRQMVLMSQATIRMEVERTDSLIRAAGAQGDIHFRPPYGKRLVGLPWYLRRTGRTTVLWTLEPDSHFSRADSMVAHVMAGARPGAIILLHVELASRGEERAALAAMIPALRERGYRFVTVSELLAMKAR